MSQENLANFSETDFQKRLYDTIERLTEGKVISDKPIAFLLGGQSGAGKTTLHKIIKAKLNRNIISIDNDTFKPLHPNIEILVEKYGKDYIRYVTPFSNHMTESLINYLSDQGYNLIIEGTLRTTKTPIKTAIDLKKKEYEVNLYVMAVSKHLSYLGTIERYESMYLDDPSTARATDKAIHDMIVSNLPDNLEMLFKSGYFSDISLFTREGTKVFSSIDTPSINPKQIIYDILHHTLPKETLISKLNTVINLAKQSNHPVPELENWKKELYQENI